MVRFLVCLVVWGYTCEVSAQQPVAYAFQDSLRMALERLGSVDAATVAAGITTAWASLGPSEQQLIRQHTRQMRQLRYPPVPHQLHYHGAWVAAVLVEAADPSTLNSYLQVSGQVLSRHGAAQALQFFRQSRTFFQHHALTYTHSFRLRPRDDTYRFAYTEPAVDTTTYQYNNYDYNASPEPEPYVPPWMQEPPAPPVVGPVMVFSSAALVFATPQDSVALQRTKGTFLILDQVFVGEGGRLGWQSAGLSNDSVYYDFKDYHFKTTEPLLRAGGGRLTYVGKVNRSMPGRFEYKSEFHRTPRQATYPRFFSYASDYTLQNLGSNKLSYTGGISLKGAALGSESLNGERSRLEIRGLADRKVRLESEGFLFEDSVVQVAHARMVIFQGYDTLVHPAVDVSYHWGRAYFLATKSKGPLRKTPFSSSFFGIDFNVDQLRWNMNTDTLDMYIPGSGNVAPMIVESREFFDPDYYRKLRGIGFSYHPVAMVVNFSNKYGRREWSHYELAEEYAIRPEQARQALEMLAQAGLVDYNPKTFQARVRERAFHIWEAQSGRADYDNMKLQAYADERPHASLNFKTRTLHMNGVQQFNLSDSLNVVIRPDSNRVTLMQNRDLKFNGRITAGNFEITGKDFTLKYDSFFINLNKIDSIRFYVTDKDGRRKRINNSMMGADSAAVAAGGLSSSASQSSGTLYINAPGNKAGLKKIPNYPRLDASGGGVIYFDRPEVLAGAYDRSVFFVVPPFKLDSLNDADPATIKFDGTFVSSGMFPGFKEKLRTMPDRSLGFEHALPASGYPLFKGDGKGFGQLSMTHAGLRLAGRIEYLAASLQSGDFVFYPDSVVTLGTIGEIKERQIGTALFPQVVLPAYKLKWLPKEDKMNLLNQKEPFALYQNTANLAGQLTVSKAGVGGSGILSTRGSEVKATDFAFRTKDFGARHAEFSVLTDNRAKPALAGQDVRLRFDLERNVATISPEVEGEAAISFPYAQFKTSIPEARWDLNTQKIVMTKARDVPLENSYFYTTRKELDSLNFMAERAEYDIKTQQLKVSGIPYITVADARITPENNEVLILENARIGQLKNTTIVIDTLNAYHRLTQGVVDIVSRKEFSGYATYQYVNAVGDTFAIKMTDFHLEPMTADRRRRTGRDNGPAEQTVATGAVADKSNLLLAPRIFYKGDMKMYATRPALQLKGYIKLDLRKVKNYNTWLRYEQSGDEKDVYVAEFEKAVTEMGRKAEAGLHFGVDNSLYITFVNEKKDAADDDFFLPSGALFFDKETGEFKIEDRAKAAGEKLSGKVFAYNEDKQEVRFEGPVTFFKATKGFSVQATSLGAGSLVNNEIKLNSMLVFDMNVPPNVFDLMARQLAVIVKNEGPDEGLGDRTDLLYKVADLVGERVARDYENRSLKAYVPLATLPALSKPLVFANVDLRWSQANRAFYSTGKLGLSHVGRTDLNAAFEGFLEMKRSDDGAPVVNLFFKAAPDAWYYFSLEENRLLVHSSDKSINETISKKATAGKAKIGDMSFAPATEDETLTFINRFRKDYLGLETRYDLYGDPSSRRGGQKKEDKGDGF